MNDANVWCLQVQLGETRRELQELKASVRVAQKEKEQLLAERKVRGRSNAPFSPRGAGRCGVGREGAVLLRPVTSTLMTGQGLSRQYPYGGRGISLQYPYGGRGLSRMAIAAEATLLGSHSSPTQCSPLIDPRKKKNEPKEQRART